MFSNGLLFTTVSMNLQYKENKSCTKGQLFLESFFLDNDNSTKIYLVVLGYLMRQLCLVGLEKKTIPQIKSENVSHTIHTTWFEIYQLFGHVCVKENYSGGAF